MPMLSDEAPTPNERAICGNAVAMMVLSRFSMKNAVATMTTIQNDSLLFRSVGSDMVAGVGLRLRNKRESD